MRRETVREDRFKMVRKKAEKKTRKVYTIKEKLEWVAEASKPGMLKLKWPKNLASRHASCTLAKKDDLLAAAGSNKTKRIKRMSHGLVKQLEDGSFKYFLIKVHSVCFKVFSRLNKGAVT